MEFTYRRWVARILGVLFALAGLWSALPAFAQSSEPLLQQVNLVYLGAFRVPEGTTNQTSFYYGGTALAYYGADNSLFITGHPWYQLSAEISIPAVVKSADVSNLNTATLIQPFSDPLEGQRGTIDPSYVGQIDTGGELIFGGKLVVAAYTYYDANASQTTSHFVRPVNLQATGQLQGPFRVGSQYPGFVDGYMTLIPAEWQTLLGGPVLSGNCCLNIISEQSNGPAASVFDPSELGTVSPTPATELVGYPFSSPLGPGETTQNNVFSLTTRIGGIVFPVGTRSVLFIGRQGIGPYCYGIGSPISPPPSGECYDPAGSSKGTHAYPYVYQVWAYDANDLVAVKQGSRRPYQIEPYAIWTLSFPTVDPTGNVMIGGAAYDPQTNRIYVSQECADAGCGPIIHVFEVNAGLVAPNPPSAIRAQ